MSKIRRAIELGEIDRACFEAGQFTERTAVKLFTELNAAPPKNAKAAIDFIMYNGVVSRPLGAKLHFVRELRNSVVHNFKFELSSNEDLVSVPAYKVTHEDASLCLSILSDLVRWISEDEIATEWALITAIFDQVKQSLDTDTNFDNDNSENNPKTDLEAVLFRLYDGLDSALSLKLHSIGVDGIHGGLLYKIKQLEQAGIDVRSSAWRDFANYMNYARHSMSEWESTLKAARFVKANWSEFLSISAKLNPSP